ncbi:MAG: AbrB family transcriptional regulator [Spirochaetia bacterium]
MNFIVSNPFVTSLLFLLISLSISYLFYRLSVPAGIIIGPIFIFTILKFADFNPLIPNVTKTVLYSIFGAFFATKLSSVLTTKIKTILIPVFMTILWYVFLTFASSTLLCSLSDIDPTNAFLSVIPGGIAEMNIIALSYQADVSIINSFQLVRLFTIIIVMPTFIKAVFKIDKNTAGTFKKAPFIQKETDAHIYIRSTPIFAIGAIGSVAFLTINFPAGGLMGSLFFVSIFEILFRRADVLPRNLYTFTLSLLGGIIGTNIDVDTFGMLSQVLLPVLVITTITVSSAFILSFLIHILLKKDYLSTLFGVMPGGLAIMLSLAESSTNDIFYVTSLQTIRLLTAVVIIPNLLLFLGFIH